jgi:hypothetical protein
MSPVDRWGLVVAIVICAVIAGRMRCCGFWRGGGSGGEGRHGVRSSTPGCGGRFAGSKGDTDMDATGSDMLRKFVGAPNKGAPHPLDWQRFYDFTIHAHGLKRAYRVDAADLD